MSGSSASARARPARFFMPPESSEGCFGAAVSSRPTIESFIEAISFISSWDMVVYSRNGTWIFSAIVWEENSAPSWNSTPQRISISRICVSLRSAVFLPNTSTVPDWNWFSPMMERSSTDLPVPEPPTTPSTSPR